MQPFCLGIIGRCLACQPWMPPSDLYHRQLKIWLQEQEKIALRVSIAGGSDVEPYERMRILHTKKPLNGVLYHMRHPPEAPLLCREKDLSGKQRYSLHPLFFKQFLKQHTPIYKDFDTIAFSLSVRRNKTLKNMFDIPPPTESPSAPRKFLGIPLGKTNLLIGKLCGLNTLTIHNEWIFFERLHTLCLELNIPLFVLGPIPSAEMVKTPKKALLWQQKCKAAENKLLEYGTPHYFLHNIDKSFYTNDRAHLSSEGHAFLAQELYPALSSWVKSHL